MDPILKDFIAFIQEAPTPWHTVEAIKQRLEDAGYVALEEKARWSLVSSKKLYVIRGGALIAFHLPEKQPRKALISASHTDSPSLKIKPHAQFRSHNMQLFRVEAYGGPLLSTWFDRDCALAGQIFVKEGKNLKRHLITTQQHVTIPSLAIHLQEKNDGTPRQYLDKQDHVCPLIGLCDKEENSLERLLQSSVSYDTLLGADLYLVPTQAPSIIGTSNDLLASYRLDNLSSAHACLVGLLQAESSEDTIHMAAFWNHEEIGSDTREGAGSPFLEETLKRLCLALNFDEEEYFALKAGSMCLSVDVAHCFHPNFASRYDAQDHPLFNHGLIIKHHAGMRYATEAELTARVKMLCKQHKLPYQESAGHSEVRGGSTVGPIASTGLGLLTIDIGAPLLAMHSTRELIALSDQLSLTHFIQHAYEELTV